MIRSAVIRNRGRRISRCKGTQASCNPKSCGKIIKHFDIIIFSICSKGILIDLYNLCYYHKCVKNRKRHLNTNFLCSIKLTVKIKNAVTL